MLLFYIMKKIFKILFFIANFKSILIKNISKHFIRKAVYFILSYCLLYLSLNVSDTFCESFEDYSKIVKEENELKTDNLKIIRTVLIIGVAVVITFFFIYYISKSDEGDFNYDSDSSSTPSSSPKEPMIHYNDHPYIPGTNLVYNIGIQRCDRIADEIAYQEFITEREAWLKQKAALEKASGGKIRYC